MRAPIEAAVANIQLVAANVTDFSHFARPSFIGGAIAAVAVGTFADIYAARHEVEAEPSTVSVEDTEIAENMALDNKTTRYRDRALYYGGLALVSLPLVQLAQPVQNHSEVKGGAAIIINADIGADTLDMTGDNGQPESRLNASILGATEGASKVDGSFTFIVNSVTATAVITKTGNTQEQGHIESLIAGDINNASRDGSDLKDSLKDAKGLSGEPNIIIIDSELSTGDQALVRSAMRYNSSTKISAIAVGRHSATEIIGAYASTAYFSKPSFDQVLGSNNVLSATTTKGVAEDVERIASGEHEVNANSSLNLVSFDPFTVLAEVAAIAVMARRFSGVFKKRKNSEQEEGI